MLEHILCVSHTLIPIDFLSKKCPTILSVNEKGLNNRKYKYKILVSSLISIECFYHAYVLVSEEYGCPADVLDFCSHPQTEVPSDLPGLGPGVTPSSSLTCQQVGMDDRETSTCHGEEVVGSHGNDIVLHFKCPEG